MPERRAFGPLHPDKLTLAKPFYITVSSAAEGIPVDIEVRERPVRKFVSVKRSTLAHRSVRLARSHKRELTGGAAAAAVGSVHKR
jgi:hypothetical protein